MTKAELCYQLMAAVWDTDFDTAREVENATTVATALGGIDTNSSRTIHEDDDATDWEFPDGSILILARNGGAQERAPMPEGPEPAALEATA